MTQPEPGHFHHRESQARIARFANPLLPVNGTTLPGCRCQPGIGCDLAPIIELTKQALAPEYGSKFGSDADDLRQYRDFLCGLSFFRKHCVPFRFHLLKLG